MAISDIDMKAMAAPEQLRPAQKPPRKRRRWLVHGVSWGVAFPVLLVLALYLVLLVTPIPVPFLGGQARAVAMASMPASMELELGDTYLALENGVSPVIRFSPVRLIDAATNGQVEMEALVVGFSPLRAMVGQPSVVITLDSPKLQVIQDLYGPRLAQFEVEEVTQDALAVVRVLEGDQPIPSVTITSEGIGVLDQSQSNLSFEVKSDNDWLIYNFVASEEGLRDIAESANAGLFSRLIIRNAQVDMHDVVFGVVRTFSDINLNLISELGTQNVDGTFSAVIAGRRMHGTIRRELDAEGAAHILTNVEDADFSSFVPFMDDPDAMLAVQGTGSVSADIRFAPSEEIKVLGGRFSMNLSGTNLRLREELFPVQTSDIVINWDAVRARFDMEESYFQAGSSHADFSGVFVMGLDDTYGPTVHMTTTMRDVFIHPNDMEAPVRLYDEMFFSGWSSPLYGALGIDQMVIKRNDMLMVTSGRLDMLRDDISVDISVGLDNASADDLKRLWPDVIGGQTRDWFVENVTGGRVVNSRMHFNIPFGVVGEEGEDWDLPEDSMVVNMVIEDVSFVPYEGFDPVFARGRSTLQVRDTDTNIQFGDAVILTDNGPVRVSNAGFTIISEGANEGTFALDGLINGRVGSILALIERHAPDALVETDLPISLGALEGNLATTLSARVRLRGDDNEVVSTEYDLQGTLIGLGSSEPIQDFSITQGNLSFTVDETGYDVVGTAMLNGLNTDVSINGGMEEGSTPNIEIAATFAAEDFKEFGFDVSEFLGGEVTFVGSPRDDGALDIAVDLQQASLDVPDIGLSKPVGQAGSLSAVVESDGPLVDIHDIALSFGDVSLSGGMKYHEENGLVSADFDSFTLNEGDVAQISLAPLDGGYALQLRGEQLDLKPFMRRFFSLDGEGTGGAQVETLEETITLDIELERALGFYSTTAVNLNANLTIHGSDLRNVSVQAQFGGGNSLSITTNPVPGGRVMSLAFSDLGRLLRFVGTYSQLNGGAGSLVLTTDTATRVDQGDFRMNDFSIVDEDKVAQLLSSQQASRAAPQGDLRFNNARATFVRRSDRIEISEVVVAGQTMGGTGRGFIYTDAGQYDLTGTFVPLFGLNNAFQQLPILGRLLGGRDGEGLFGITFAIRGDLNDPQFLMNPASMLVPGAFRSIFEFRAQERPPAN